MPSNILTTDTSFPQLTDQQTTDEKFGVITNYLYMLLEQLRYTLRNLGLENFNEAEFDGIVTIITEPVYARIENAEGDIAQLQLTAEELTVRMEDAEGNISVLQLTAKDLTVRMEDAEGNISTLQLTASSLTSRIENAEGDISVLQQTATRFDVRLTNAEGGISSLSMTVNSITLSVSNGEDRSTIRLMKNGISVASEVIRFTGMVTFTDLSGSGTTIINGDNITTGTISAINISGCYIEGSVFRTTLSYGGSVGGEIQFYYERYLAGGIRLDDQGAGTQYENRYRMFVYTESAGGTSFAMKLQAAGGISIETGEDIFIEASGTVTINGSHVYINGEEYPPVEKTGGN